jgi:WD repeat-containing protein 76
LEIANDSGIDVYSSKGELINHFSEAELITAVPAVVQFHPRKDWIVGGTASGKVAAYGLPEHAD